MNYSAYFNSSTSKIDCGSEFIGTRAITLCGWFKANTFGEGGTDGVIISNGKFILSIGSNSKLYFNSDGATNSTSNAITGFLFKYIFFAITRKLDGKASFYIGFKNTAPVISNTADQSSGTPANGTSNVLIGNNSISSKTFGGSIKMLNVYEGILTINEITAIWQQTRRII